MLLPGEYEERDGRYYIRPGMLDGYICPCIDLNNSVHSVNNDHEEYELVKFKSSDRKEEKIMGRDPWTGLPSDLQSYAWDLESELKETRKKLKKAEIKLAKMEEKISSKKEK